MPSTATAPGEYLNQLPEDKKKPMTQLRSVIIKNLPKGFEETMSSGMISYVVPHSLYPAGYHCDPKQPLPFLSIAAQKNFIAVYHMGIYVNEDLLHWFQQEYAKHSKTKLDMGKSCIRLKKIDEIPFSLFGELACKITPKEWIETYEQQIKQ